MSLPRFSNEYIKLITVIYLKMYFKINIKIYDTYQVTNLN